MKKLFSWLKVIWPIVVAGAKKSVAVVVAGIVALVAKVKVIKWTRAKLVALGVVVALVAVTMITAKLVKHKQQPVAATTNKVTITKKATVIENPTVKQTAKADTTITEQASIKASGTVKVKSKTSAMAKESKTKYTIPLTGTANTTYTDTAGATVGQGTHAVTGQANVTVTDNTATADVVINDTTQVAITTTRIKRKNEVGGYAGVAACSDPYFYVGGYYQRNLLFYEGKKADMALFARASVERHWGADEDWEGRLAAGVRVEW